MSITSFEGPFPTEFSAPESCSHITSDVIVGFDFASSCLPDNFNPDPQAYYSPGTGCPSGYTAQKDCTRSNGGTTTLTCCPARGDLELWCVPEPETLSGPWQSMMCTWSAGDLQTVLLVTAGEDATVAVTMTGGDGLNAYGLKMVYEASDLEEATTTATETTWLSTATTVPETSEEAGPSLPKSTSGGRDGADDGRTRKTDETSNNNNNNNTAIIAVAVVVPVVLIALGIAFFLWYRKRKQNRSVELPVAASDPSNDQGWQYPSADTGANRYAANGGFVSTGPGQTGFYAPADHGYYINEFKGDNGHPASQIQLGWSQPATSGVHEMPVPGAVSELPGDVARSTAGATKPRNVVVTVEGVPEEGNFRTDGNNLASSPSQEHRIRSTGDGHNDNALRGG